MAVADASFKTSIDSISEGLIVDSAFKFGPSATVPPKLSLLLSTGNPSMTYNGSLPALMELLPLVLTDVAAPGCPEVCVNNNPDTRPCTNSSGVVTFVASNSFDFIDEIEPVKSFFLVLP